MTALPQPSPFRTVIEAMFRIVNKDGVAVDFRLNPMQARLDAAWARRIIIPKARQEGVSSYVVARYTAKCLGLQNRTCVVISHEAEATQRLLGKADYILANLKGEAAPVLGRKNRNEIEFKKTNSTFYIGTAGARAFGHGDTITDLHLSEVSRYPDAGKIIGGTFPAAERGEICLESTGNGVGDVFHEYCVAAREGYGFKLHFIPWVEDQEYALPFASESERTTFAASLSEEFEEPTLRAGGLTLEQLQWRREQITVAFRRDLRKFKESYPLNFDECFQSKEYGFFNRMLYREAEAWGQESASLWTLSPHPKPGLTYVVGADPAGGVGADNSVAEVFCLEEKCQVAEYASATVEPPGFADQLAALGKRFNNAYINVERNNHGGTVLARLIDVYPLWLVHRGSRGDPSTQQVLSRLSHYGTVTSPASRGTIIGTARELLATEFTVHSPLLRSELLTFVEKQDGKIEADTGCKDDRVMAAAMALIVVERAGIVATANTPRLPPAEADPFSFEALFGEQGRERTIFGVAERFH